MLCIALLDPGLLEAKSYTASITFIASLIVIIIGLISDYNQSEAAAETETATSTATERTSI